MSNLAYVLNADGEIINIIVANPEVDIPPAGCALISVNEVIPDSTPASGFSADIG